MGVTHHLNGVSNVEAIANLALFRGQVGKKGAGLLPLRGHSNVQGIGTVGVKPSLANDVMQHLESTFNVKLPRTEGMDTLACLRAAHAGNINAALIQGGNLYAASPHSSWAEEAMDRIGFKVFLTTTLNRGHITGVQNGESLVLPVTARDEEWQPTTQESMFNYVRLSDGGIKRLDGVMPGSRILCEFAKRLLPDCPFDFETFSRHDTVRAAISSAIPGLKALADIDETKKEFTVEGRILHDTRFPTKSGRAIFQTIPLLESRASEEYPWLLASIRSEGQFNTIIYYYFVRLIPSPPFKQYCLRCQDLFLCNIARYLYVVVHAGCPSVRCADQRHQDH
jgi:anaerobic selenocysteine-containing dehydrogenase